MFNEKTTTKSTNRKTLHPTTHNFCSNLYVNVNFAVVPTGWTLLVVLRLNNRYIPNNSRLEKSNKLVDFCKGKSYNRVCTRRSSVQRIIMRYEKLNLNWTLNKPKNKQFKNERRKWNDKTRTKWTNFWTKEEWNCIFFFYRNLNVRSLRSSSIIHRPSNTYRWTDVVACIAVDRWDDKSFWNNNKQNNQKRSHTIM